MLVFERDPPGARGPRQEPDGVADRGRDGHRHGPTYTLGKGVGYLPAIHRVFSQAVVERFFRRFFRVKTVG